VVYLSAKEITKKWTQSPRDWAMAYSQIMIFLRTDLWPEATMRALPSISRGLYAQTCR
jgi:hypothetical protein